MNCYEAEPLLNPYVDAELDLVTAVRVEEHIAACAGCGGQYRDLCDLRRQIAEAELDFAPGTALARRVAAVPRASRAEYRLWWERPWTLAPLTAVVLLLLVIPTYLPKSDPAGDSEMFENHMRSLMESHLVDVPSSDHHTVKPWFQGRLDFSPGVPELSGDGFVLTGGRLEMVRRRPAAAIVYKRGNHVINLFVSPASGPDSTLRARTNEGYNLVTWVNGDLSYSAVSELNAEELMHFAQLARSR